MSRPPYERGGRVGPGILAACLTVLALAPFARAFVAPTAAPRRPVVSAAPDPTPASTADQRLRVAGRVFVNAAGSRFDWRGLTSFRLAEMVAHGRTQEVIALLDWTAGQRITVVRVLAMARNLFNLSPEEGRKALSHLLGLARERGLYVEVVALADTRDSRVRLEEQVRAVGAICAQHDNCVLEIANEPWHPTQRAGLGDPETLRGLRALVPAVVPVAYGSHREDDSDAYAAGDYITVHVRRSDGWEHVLRMRQAARLADRVGKPVIDDEPIGAAARPERGRRDSDPTRWLAKGALARLYGLGATFHYQAGLAAQIPRGVEARCFEAWQRGLDALPLGLVGASISEAGSANSPVVSFDGPAPVAVDVAERDGEAWAVALGVTGSVVLRWRDGWRVQNTKNLGGVVIESARRQ